MDCQSRLISTASVSKDLRMCVNDDPKDHSRNLPFDKFNSWLSMALLRIRLLLTSFEEGQVIDRHFGS